MPSKGKRVAVRQSNLRRRRGNANRGAAVASRAAVATTETATAVAAPAADAASAAATATPAAPHAATRRSVGPPRGRRFDRPAAYNHVGSELTRIGIFSGVLLVILVAVSFVL